MRWNNQHGWVVSKQLVHTPLIDDDTFARAQALLSVRATSGTSHTAHRTAHPYLFRGLITHGLCDRRMQDQWSHGDAYYRCRFPEEYALANRVEHPRNVHLRESWLVPPLDDWLRKVFAPHRLHGTIDLMTTAADAPSREDAALVAARATITDCDAKLATHRATLEAGADPLLVTRWIAETQAKRAAAEATLRAATGGPDTPMSRDEIARLVHGISDLVAVVRRPAPRTRPRSTVSWGSGSPTIPHEDRAG